MDSVPTKMRRFQFSVRNLLMLTAVVAAGIVVFQSSTGSTLDHRLLVALKSDRTIAIKFYLLLGADPDEGHGVTSYGGNALHWAALHGEENYVKRLLAAGATVNCFEKDGFTPIVYAADRGHWEIVKMLFDAGADYCATGTDGARVVDYAMTAGRDDIVQMLTNNDFSPNYWSVETFATPLKEDRDGLLSNRVWQVFPTSRWMPLIGHIVVASDDTPRW